MVYSHKQTTLFDLLPPEDYTPKPAAIRARLLALLGAARAATRMPWPAQEAEVNATIFPQMAQWLPEPERAELRAAFAAEMARLRAAG
jgi:hypothetical protein